MTTLKQLPERAHHVFIDVGGDTFDDMMSLVDHLIEGVRDGGASTVSGGYSSGGFYVYRQSAITHDEYMAVIDQRNSGEYHMRSDDELMADAERDALRAEVESLRAALAAAPMEAPIHVWWFGDAPEHLRNLSTSGGDEDWLAEVAPEVAETARFWMYPGSAFGYCDVDEFPHPTRPGWVVRIGSHA